VHNGDFGGVRDSGLPEGDIGHDSSS
jgi:hypothetical protein